MVNSVHRQPIGYWVKEAHNLLYKWFDRIHAGHSLSRLAWQILNSIQLRTAIAVEDLIVLLIPFADGDRVRSEIASLTSQELIRSSSAQLQLTAKGKLIHKEYLERQQLLRNKLMQGISTEDYETTIHTLQQIVNNLNSDEI